MTQETIKCPKCGEVFELSSAISQDIELRIRKRYESQMQKVKESAKRDLEAKDKEREEMIAVMKKEVEEKAKTFAEQSLGLELADLREQLKEKTEALDDSQERELHFLKQKREFESKQKEFEIEKMRWMDIEGKKIAESTAKEIEETNRLKDAEKDKQLSDMKKQIENLKRKAEQGSQQTQGEVLELELEDRLRSEFPIDEILPVAKGTKGGDVLQGVKTQAGRECGKILWETKRAKNWSDSWIQKLKDDQRTSKADVAVIVTEVLPKTIERFGLLNGIWVSDISSAIALSMALRSGLIQLAREREFQSGKKGKMELIYNYITGQEFRNRVEAIMESFVTIKKDLDAEKRAMEKIWAKREKNIERVVQNISGMRGDLEGIAGSLIPAIKMLDLEPEQLEA